MLLKHHLIPFTDDLLSEVITIRKNYRLKLPDAIIAATAIHLNATLITSDLRGFSKVPNLKTWVPERVMQA